MTYNCIINLFKIFMDFKKFIVFFDKINHLIYYIIRNTRTTVNVFDDSLSFLSPDITSLFPKEFIDEVLDRYIPSLVVSKRFNHRINLINLLYCVV